MTQQSNKKTTILAALLLVLAGQLNINIIVHGFTISMSIVFFILLAFLVTEFHPFATTILAAPLMVLTRGVIAWLNGANFFEAIMQYAPEVIFIILYGAMFSLYMRKVTFKKFQPINFLPLIGIDFLANVVEIYIRLGNDGWNLSVLSKLLIIAVGRTLVAGILVAAFDYYGNFLIRKEEQQRYKNLLLLMAELKSEVIWMNKNTKDIEHITANAYEIYQHIKETKDQEYQEKALELAKDIHEIKKEYALIMRGITETLAEEETSDQMQLSYLLQVLKESLLSHYEERKELLYIQVDSSCDLVTDKHYFLLAILRNLVTNAIEAGEGQEEIEVVIRSREEETYIILEVEDHCGGIDKEDLKEIFKPGFSTKIDYDKGSTGRGLGLCIVKDLVEMKLGGILEVQDLNSGTKFTMKIPKEEILCRFI